MAAGVAVVLWWQGPNWSLLYGNLSDADASSVVQALQTAGIEYKLDNASGAIMVPAERVHDARLQLAAQGLPEGKSSSLDLMNKDPGFGVSQFMENARYQYALESELARTISIAAGGRGGARAPGVAAAVGLRARPASGQRLGAAAAASRRSAASPNRSRRSCIWWHRAFPSSTRTT